MKVIRSEEQMSKDATPRGVYVDRFGPELTIVRSWRTTRIWHYLLLSAFMSPFAAFFAVALMRGGLQTILIPFVPCAIAWLYATYSLVCRLVNRTRICVSQDHLEVRHGPLPWFGSGVYRPAELCSIFCVESKHVQKSVVRFTYDLVLWKHDGSHHVLISGLDDEQQALFIEREIEQFLKLTKELVPDGYEVRPERQAERPALAREPMQSFRLYIRTGR